MNDHDSEWLRILRIGHDVSRQGSGISLKAALMHSRYREHRLTFEPSDLAPLICANAELCRQWLAYSEDKRTRGGWYLLADGTVGSVQPMVGSPVRFNSMEEAVAEFVVRELDFWSARLK